MGSSTISLGGMTAQVGVQQVQETRTLEQLNSLRSGTNDASKIEKGSKQFETMLLSSWLQQAEKSFATVPGADDDQDQKMSGSDQMMSLGVQSLAQAMEASGGIGIAKMIAKAMTAQADKAAGAAPAADSAAEPAHGGQNSEGNLSFRLNSVRQSADSVAGSVKGSQSQ
jgi:Rod binding domain-containing protein